MTVSIKRITGLALATLATAFLLMAEKSCDDGSGPWRQVNHSAVK